MEFNHGKSWSMVALILAFATLLLYYYGDVYALVGVFIGFMSLVFMSAMYFNLYTMYDEIIVSKEEEEIRRKRGEEISSL